MEAIAACLITVAAETVFFAAFRYRRGSFLTVCVFLNVATNLGLNMLLGYLSLWGKSLSLLVYPLEIAVVLIEFAVFSLLEGPSKKLFLLTLGANCLSYGLGILIFGHL